MRTTDQQAQTDELFTALLEPSSPLPVAPAPQAVEPPPATISTKKRAQRNASVQVKDTYERVGTTIALLGALAGCIGLWWVGAYFTLRFLTNLGIALAHWGVWAYLIPLTITAAELFLWPGRMSSRWHTLWWVAVLAFDVGSTASGVVVVLAGRTIPLFTASGITVPQDGAVLIGLGVVVGLVCALAPEKYGKRVLNDLYALWS